MGNVRLLSFEDLYEFYVAQGKSLHFNAAEEHANIVVQVPGVMKFEKSDKDTEGLRPVVLQACHTEENRNHSFISEDTMKAALPSFSNRPILGYIHEVDGRPEFYTHCIHEGEDGNTVYDEIPIGTVPESCNARLEYDEEKGKTYCVVNGYIYEEYSPKAIEILEREEECACSVELSVRELSYNAQDKILSIDDYFYEGVTILGKTPDGEVVEPGMEGANIKLADFSAENNSFVYDHADLVDKIADAVAKRLSNKADDSALYLKEGGKTPLKFEELLKQYNKTAEDIEFDYANMSDEELETAFKTAFDDPDTEPASEPTDAEAAAAVTALIEALPSTITTDSESDITAAREAYDVLSAEAKALVTAETLAILTGAESSLGDAKAAAANQTAADAVTALIEALSNDITMDDADAVTAAGQAYDSLTPAQKALISSDDVTALEEARNVIAKGLSADEGAKNKKKKQNNELTYTVVINDVEKTFAVSLVDKLNALSQLVNNTYSESDNTYYDVDAYDDEKYVIMHDYWNNKHFRQSYSVKKNVYSLKGDRVEVFAQYLTADQIAKLDSMKADYASITEKLANYEAEPQKMEILNSDEYANIADTAEFAELKKEENHFEMSIDELKAECDRQLLAYAKGNKIEFKADAEKKSVGMKQFGQKSGKKSGRYGNLFKK